MSTKPNKDQKKIEHLQAQLAAAEELVKSLQHGARERLRTIAGLGVKLRDAEEKVAYLEDERNGADLLIGNLQRQRDQMQAERDLASANSEYFTMKARDERDEALSLLGEALSGRPGGPAVKFGSSNIPTLPTRIVEAFQGDEHV